ncbi:MAG: PQQ-binding-like beta-propeller repeat protein [Phycisphaerae bacterium]|nr:PQQ-binding-like beta-propeller repeat protein [Phycisphaerae bacterium]
MKRAFGGLGVLVAALAMAAGAARADDWPQFRGIKRDGISREKDLMNRWPEGGPKKLWDADVGTGFASVAIADGKVYAAGVKDRKLVVTALNEKDGKQVWQKEIDGDSGGGGHAGSRSTPTVDGDRLYILSEQGKLACLKTSDGSEVWAKNILQTYGAKNIQWRLSESVLVDGDHVLCSPGGRAAMVALNKMTGEEVWASEGIEERSSYGSVTIIQTGALRQAIGFSASFLFAVNADTGDLLWKQPQKNQWDVNATTVVYDDGIVYSTCGYGWGGQALKLSVNGKKASVSGLWTDKTLDDHFGGIVLLKGHVFGTPSRGGLVMLKLADGKVAYHSREVKKSSNIFADGLLYCQGHDGTMQLVDPNNGKVVSSFKIQLQTAGKMWAHPAIANGKLYIHHDSTLTVYNIKGR